jgi:Fur family peroxide stress response transcriptional regulator
MLNQSQKIKTLSEKMTDFENACKKAGLKITHQRLEVFRELAGSLDHPSAETLYKRLLKKLPTISLDTVYRTLATFEQHELIIRVDTVESQARFEAEMGKHHHIICRKCGKITDFQWDSFDGKELPLEVKEWGSVGKRQATLYGICSECQASSKPD